MLIAFVDNSDLVDRNICDLVVLVAQVKHAILDIDDVTAKCGIRAAGDVDLFSEELS